MNDRQHPTRQVIPPAGPQPSARRCRLTAGGLLLKGILALAARIVGGAPRRVSSVLMPALLTAMICALPSQGWADREDGAIYCVTKNAENDYSIWFQDRETPLGWTSIGVCGTKQFTLDWIEANWTDKRPPALRKKQCEACAQQKGPLACKKDCEEFYLNCRLSWRFLPARDGQAVPPIKVYAVSHGERDTLLQNAGGPEAPAAAGVVESLGITGTACSVGIVLLVQGVGMVSLAQTLPSGGQDQCAVTRRGTWEDGWARGECSRAGSDIVIRVAP